MDKFKYMPKNNRLIKLIAELNQNKKQLISTKVQKEVQKKDLSVLTTKLSDQKQLVDQTKQEKNSLLSATQSKETAYQKLLQDRLAKKRAVERCAAVGLSSYSSPMCITCTMAAHSRMLPKNWLPSPSPLLAPRTRPAMSIKSTLA